MKIEHVNIEVTKICNQSCSYCFNDSSPKSLNKSLSSEEWEKLLAIAKEKGLKSVHLTGGEPFTYKNIIQLIKICQNLDFETSILSNGFKISSYAVKYPEIFRRLKLAQISLDSLNEELNNKRRGYKKAYSDAISSIDALNHLGVPIEISMTIDAENINEIDEMIQFANKFKAKLILRPLILKGRNELNIFEDVNEKIKYFEFFQNIEIKDKFYYVTHLPVNDKSIIQKGYLTILPEGNIESDYLNNKNIFKFVDLFKVA